MASKTSKPWGTIGSWALDSELEEQRYPAELPSNFFPSLKEAVAAEKPKKKNRCKPISLFEFTTGTYVGPGGGKHHKDSIVEPKGLTADEHLRLPTGPRERSADEVEHGRVGGGFRGYGSYGGGRREEREGRRNYGSGYGEEGGRGEGFGQMPSRADDADDWGAGKRSLGSSTGGGRSNVGVSRRDRYENLGNGGGTMRGDEVHNWSLGKKQILPSRSSGFGSNYSSSGSLEGRDFRTSGTAANCGDRPRLVLDPPKRDAGIVTVMPNESVKTRPSPFGSARPREEILEEKGVDWRKVDSETKISRTVSPHSSNGTSPALSINPFGDAKVPELGLKPRAKVNPFGDAKPREVLLEEKGMDWRKIDMELEHCSIERPDTEQEKLLKEEINQLKETLRLSIANERNADGKSTEQLIEENPGGIHDQIIAREKELDLLMHDLDDKVKFGKKAISEKRPGSGGSGRTGASSFSDRPPSQSSIPDEVRGSEYFERPNSRGSIGDTRSHHTYDRRAFRRVREGEFFNTTPVMDFGDMVRPRSSHAW